MGFLSLKIDEHREVLEDLLVVDNNFLTFLVQEHILDVHECLRIENQEEKTEKVSIILQRVQSLDNDATYRQFLQALRMSGQKELEDLLSSLHVDLADLSQFQKDLEDTLREMKDFFRRAERRAEVINNSSADEEVSRDDPSTNFDLQTVTVSTLKMILAQFERCKTIIEKLHEDCTNVARINSDIMEQVQQCDLRIRGNLNYRKRGQAPPHSSQEMFCQLVKDISELTKRHSRDAAKNTETKLPSLRLIRQCNEWLRNRIVGLRGAPAVEPPKTLVSESRDPEDESGDVDGDTNSKDLMTNVKDPLLDSLKEMEENLQKYMRLEIRGTDELRRLLRVRHLQRVSQSYTSRVIREVEETLQMAETDDNRDVLQRTSAHLDNMATEYDECVSVLQRFIRATGITDKEEALGESESGNSRKKTSRKAKKSKEISRTRLDQVTARESSPSKSGQSPRAHGAPYSVVLPLIQQLIKSHQNLKDEIASLKTKYRAELDKKKRDFEGSLEKSVFRNNELLVQIKELNAEKEKYKKLYNSAKVSFLNAKPQKLSGHTSQTSDYPTMAKSNGTNVFVTEPDEYT